MTRDQIQQEVVDNSDKRLIILDHCTGLGKSFSALKVIDRWKPKKVLLLIAEIAHRKNWLEEIDKFNSMYNKNISIGTIECYASIKHYQDTEWDMVILDESHHLSDLRLSYLKTIKADKYIALSATLSKDDIHKLTTVTNTYFETIYYSKISLNKAINWRIIPKPQIYLLPLYLDNESKSEMIIEKWGTKSKRKTYHSTIDNRWTYMANRKKYPHTRLVMQATQQEKYDYIVQSMAYWKNRYDMTGQYYARNLWLQAGSQRKRFLGELKTPYVKKLLEDLVDTRYICFCSSIEQANDLGEERAIHSKIPKSEKDQILEDFQLGKTNSIYAVGMLTEGQNLKDIEAGVIVQLDGKVRPFVQKTGRVLRSEEPVQYIFYYKDTRDEEFLENILEGIDPKFIQGNE